MACLWLAILNSAFALPHAATAASMDVPSSISGGSRVDQSTSVELPSAAIDNRGTAIPEPSPMLMAGIGLLGFILLLRHRAS